jgi:hypothetical protein
VTGLLSILFGQALGQTRRSARQALTRIALGLGAAVLALAGLGFLLAAAWMMLARALGPGAAGLILGVLLLLLSGACFLALRARRPLRRDLPSPPDAPLEAGPAAMAAFVAAFVLARRWPRSDR